MNTIIEYDKIISIEEGKLIEYDSPFNLLQNPNSLFYSLVSKTGKDNLFILERQLDNHLLSKTKPLLLKMDNPNEKMWEQFIESEIKFN